MAHYVDGFVIPLPKKNLNAYRRLAQKAGKVWRDTVPWTSRSVLATIWPQKWRCRSRVGSKPGLVRQCFFLTSYLSSRAHRDRVNAKVMKDARLAKMMDPKAMPFDVKRMMYGGFKTIVEA
jgi:uncharacterized protein YbaA (DUF1428 family)